MPHVLRLFPMKPVRCPCCRLRVDGEHVWIHRNCVACGAVFRIRRRYFWTMYLLALLASFGIAFVIGNRGNSLSSLALLLVLPTAWGMLMINLRLFPVDLEVVVEGWTPGDSDSDRELEREFELLRELDPVLGWPNSGTHAPVLEKPTDSAPGPLPLSTPKDPPVTFEGIAIAVALSALLAYHVYVAIEPHITIGRTSPESVAPLPPERESR
jgi:hypothetical protein